MIIVAMIHYSLEKIDEDISRLIPYFRKSLYNAAETVLGYFGFDANVYKKI